MTRLAGLFILLTCSVVVAHDGPHGHSHAEDDGTVQVATALTSEVEFEVRDGYRYVVANGLPDHKPGRFPNRGNPNRIQPQRYKYRIPAEPRIAEEITSAAGQPFGIAVNGVVFDPGTAEFWRNDRRSGWNYEALSGKINLGLDDSNAHVQPTGAYHYHGIPNGLIERLAGEETSMLLLGYAADGFPIYGPHAPSDADDLDSELVEMKSGYRIKRGQRPGGPGGRYDGTFVADYEYVDGLGDLDECNGRKGVTPEYPEGTYYYVLTDTFPFIPRNFRGTPDRSFERRGPPPGGRRPPPPRRRPR